MTVKPRLTSVKQAFLCERSRSYTSKVTLIVAPGTHGVCIHGSCRDMCYLYDDKGVEVRLKQNVF